VVASSRSAVGSWLAPKPMHALPPSLSAALAYTHETAIAVVQLRLQLVGASCHLVHEDPTRP
jgi:hypothetical protein